MSPNSPVGQSVCRANIKYMQESNSRHNILCGSKTVYVHRAVPRYKDFH